MKWFVALACASIFPNLSVKGQVLDFVFDLSNYSPENKTTHYYKQLVNLTEGSTKILVQNVPDDVGFYIVQVHTFLENITLSETEDMQSQTFITGRNVGLVGKIDKTFFLIVPSNAKSLLVITIYKKSDPVPGGCNLTFDTDIAPYQIVVDTDDVTFVQSQAPSARKTTCERDNIKVDLYHMYLPEGNFDESVYYEGLAKMLTVDDIKAHAYKTADALDGYFKYRKMYSAYRGVGHVFGIIATFRNGSSAYVPAVSYGCDLSNKEETCYGPLLPHWKLLCALLLIFGPFICFCGHRSFRMTLYLVGFTAGVFITYLVLSFSSDLEVTEKATASLVIGLLYASVWVLVWWQFGIPILSVSVTLFMAAYLISATLFYNGLADLMPFRNDLNYWLTFVSVIVAFIILWGMYTLQGHIFACSFLGSYACVTALNYYFGGNLQYIIINSFRRIIVHNFGMATIDPPFQIADNASMVIWVALFISGIYFQWREQRGKPPFPPPHNEERELVVVDETTPLIRGHLPVYVY